MKIITVKNENCDYDDAIFSCEDLDVWSVYLKNNQWHLYGSFNIKSQKDYDEILEEVMLEAHVSASNVKMVKPLSANFTEINYEKLINSKLEKQKLAAKKKIQTLKKKFGI
jgi:hypothetical protein